MLFLFSILSSLLAKLRAKVDLQHLVGIPRGSVLAQVVSKFPSGHNGKGFEGVQ